MKRLMNFFVAAAILICFLSGAAAAQEKRVKRIIVMPGSVDAGVNEVYRQILPDRMNLYISHSNNFSCVGTDEWSSLIKGNFDYKNRGNAAFSRFSGVHADYILFGETDRDKITYHLYNCSSGDVKSKEVKTGNPADFENITILIEWLKKEVGGDFAGLDDSQAGLSVIRYKSANGFNTYLNVLYGSKGKNDLGKILRDGIRQMEQVKKDDPGFLSGRELYASLLFSSGNIKKSKSEYEQIIGANPRFLPAIIGIAMIFDHESQPDKAAEFIFRESGGDMKPLLLYNYALFLGKAGNIGKSQETYQTLLAVDPYNKAARINLASLLFSLNNYDEALEIYEGLKNDYPDELMNDYTISSIYIRKGETGKARGILLDLAEKGKFKEVYNDLGIICRREEEYESAELFLKKALEIDPAYYPAYNNLGILYSIQDKNDQAENCFNEALKINPTSSDALYNLGIINFKKGDLNRAWVYFSRASTVSPGFTRAKMNLAIIEMKRGNLNTAEKILQKCADENGSDALIHYNLGVLYRSLGKYSHAVQSFRRALFTSPDMADAANNIGAILIREKKFEEAADWIDKALALSPEDPVYLFNRGLTEFYRENYDRAADYFLNALLKDKDSPRVSQFLISSLLADGRYDEAKKHIDHMQKLNPDNLEFEYQRAVFLERTGRDKLAAETLEKLIERGYIPDAARNLAMLYIKMKEFDKAEKIFRDLLALDPKDTRTLVEKAKAYSAQGKNDEAAKILLSVIAIDSKNKSAYIYIGNIYIKDNSMDKAEIIFEKASAAFPDETDFIFNHALSLLYQGKTEKALERMKAAVEKSPDKAVYHYNLALIYKKLGDRKNLLNELKTTFNLNPAFKNEFINDEDFRDMRNDRDVLKLLSD